MPTRGTEPYIDSPRDLDDAVDLLCNLDDPVRRACYQAVRGAAEPLTRAAVAESVGISTGLAAFHLDKLVDVGFLDAEYARTSGRGRGGGRPAKRYRPSSLAVEITVPPRRYDVVGMILAESISTGASREDVSRRVGAEIGAAHRRRGRRARNGVLEALADLGFEPFVDGAVIVQRNCPFSAVQRVAPEVVCGLNRDVTEGIITGAGATDDITVELAPAAGRCCVLLHAVSTLRRQPAGP
jgi:predicted ArsR family transcriptional regulator